MKKIVALLAVLALALTAAACGTTDHGGYASPQEGCQAEGSKVHSGPNIEPDEVEFYCENGVVIEGQRNEVRGQNAKDHKNAWTKDEDSLQCADGTEITTGDEGASKDYSGNTIRESCDKYGGTWADPKPKGSS